MKSYISPQISTTETCSSEEEIKNEWRDCRTWKTTKFHNLVLFLGTIFIEGFAISTTTINSGVIWKLQSLCLLVLLIFATESFISLFCCSGSQKSQRNGDIIDVIYRIIESVVLIAIGSLLMYFALNLELSQECINYKRQNVGHACQDISLHIASGLMCIINGIISAISKRKFYAIETRHRKSFTKQFDQISSSDPESSTPCLV